MSDYTYGGADEIENAELKKLDADVLSSPDDYEAWQKLVAGAEALEGGLNRNSSPQSIAAARDIYDRFLAKFPLFFGYWKKYADLEFAIAGTEAAEMVSPAVSLLYKSKLTTLGLRARYCKHRHFCRSLGQLLRLQGRNQPRSRHDQRVSPRPFTHMTSTQTAYRKTEKQQLHLAI